MLETIALGHTPFPWPDIQNEAIFALASRHDPQIAETVTSMLREPGGEPGGGNPGGEPGGGTRDGRDRPNKLRESSIIQH